jgi:ubiquinone/menaquinone biosynthesis C-methylase UbiE
MVEMMRNFKPAKDVYDTVGKKRAEDIFKKIEKYLGKNDKILELGAGTCHIVEFLRNRNFDVTPLDVINISFIDGINPIIYDGKTIPFKDNYFDISLLITVLHHCQDPEDVLKEAKRVSKKVIVIEDVYDNTFEKYVTFVWDSLINLEFFGHPHSNKSHKEWRETFKKLDLKLDGYDRSPLVGGYLNGTYFLTKTKPQP